MFLLLLLMALCQQIWAREVKFCAPTSDGQQKQKADSVNLPYRFSSSVFSPADSSVFSSPLFLSTPSNVNRKVIYDPETGLYTIYEKVGSEYYRLPRAMTLEEYSNYQLDESVRNYWRQKIRQAYVDTTEEASSIIPEFNFGGETFDKLFGGNTVDIVPQGYVGASLGYTITKTENPSLPENKRTKTSLEFNQNANVNISGKIGDRLYLQANYNSSDPYGLGNDLKLDYKGNEDDIIQKIEAGNISMPLDQTLISGQTDLFGVKAQMQFGKLSLTTVFSQSEGETKVIQTKGGAVTNDFEIKASEYDANRHFFLAQYFRDHYDDALKKLPSVLSRITIQKVEVWVTNKTGATANTRNIVAFQDLGEHKDHIYNQVSAFQDMGGQTYPDNVYPYNKANGLYEALKSNYSAIRTVSAVNKTLSSLESDDFYGGVDYVKVALARKLKSSEYTINKELGYISLNSALSSDQVLAVAFSYTSRGKVYQVGEFSTDGISAPKTLIVKLLKTSGSEVDLPSWDLMMKNVYSLGSSNIQKTNFKLAVLYKDKITGRKLSYLTSSNLRGRKLLKVLNMDNMNAAGNKGTDGNYDLVDGVTVNMEKGLIYLPAAEPFGSFLSDSLSSVYRSRFVYSSLYDSTLTYAQEDTEHDKFVLSGTYSGSVNSEISLGSTNLSQGAVTVTCGGRTLTENVDYAVNYLSGTVKILNSSLLESGQPITIHAESSDLSTVKQKTFLGVDANYAFSKHFSMGATVLHLEERSLTGKVNYGDEPVSNTMLGMNVRYSNDAPFLTRWVNKLPFIKTDAPSSISFEGEVAKLIAGTSNSTDEPGTAYIDDFETSDDDVSLVSWTAWHLASTPQDQDLFPEADLDDNLAYGMNRAKLAWYIVDPLFQESESNTPDYIKNDKDLMSDNLTREVDVTEIYPDKEVASGQSTRMPVLNVAFYPKERGPYNFDTSGGSYSAGLNSDGTLKDPESRWGGITRSLETTDFESANIGYIEFWLMDPFVNDSLSESEGGDLYFDLGDISEDILKDSRQSYENGLPTSSSLDGVDTTIWGNVPSSQQTTTSFVNNDATILAQDVGLDGLDDEGEQQYYQTYLNDLEIILDQDVMADFQDDPSGDDYHYYRGTDYDKTKTSILDRYKKYNGTEGNSVPASDSPESYATAATTRPDVEDLNSDYTMNEYERYYQYHVSLRPEDMNEGYNDITDIQTSEVTLANGKTTTVKWYKFQIPIHDPDETVGKISDFSSIQYMRMFLRGFQDSVVLRFGTLELAKSDWRTYSGDLSDSTVTSSASTSVDVSTVGLEDNSSRDPVNYVLPPNISRETDITSTEQLLLDEQSLELKVLNLGAGDARAVYKSMDLDFRKYRRLKLEVHAEAIEGDALDDDELYFFIRMGSDYNNNYYEYELPLAITPAGDYSNNSDQDRYEVWPDANRINIPLSLFTDLKIARNKAMSQSNSNLALTDVYEAAQEDWNDGKNLVKIKGNPNLGDVEVMMMGVRNKNDSVLTAETRSVDVWTDELRLAEADNEGGWATHGEMNMQLADLGTVDLSGTYTSAGFGSIDQGITERSTESYTSFDFSTSLNLDKFFPQRLGLKIPFYYSYSQTVGNPEYNPLDPDLTMSESLSELSTSEERDSLKNLVQDFSSYKSISFDNVRIENKGKGKSKFYNPSNFSLSYSYNERNDRDVDTEYDTERNYKGSLSYQFSPHGRSHQPFKDISFLKGKAFQLFRDFNFSLMPTRISFTGEIYRHYNEIQTRDVTGTGLDIDPTVDKDFLLNHYLTLHFRPAKSLKVDFSIQGNARVQEPDGAINKNDDDYSQKKDSIMKSLFNFGKPVWYEHTINASYIFPFSKIPGMKWVQATGRYQTTMEWTKGTEGDDSLIMGNTLENTRIKQLNTSFNMIAFYRQFPWLRKINQRIISKRHRVRWNYASKTGIPAVLYVNNHVSLPMYKPTIISHNLRTKSVHVFVTDSSGVNVPGRLIILTDNELSFTPDRRVTNGQIRVETVDGRSDNFWKNFGDLSAQILLSLKSVSIAYSASDGTTLPGYLPTPHLFGGGRYHAHGSVSASTYSAYAPGIGFMLGKQDPDFVKEAAKKGWLTADTSFYEPFEMAHSKSISFQTVFRPVDHLKLTLSGTRTYARNLSEYYLYNADEGRFEDDSKTIYGSFSMSVNTWRTAFEHIGKADVQSSDAFDRMMSNREIISKRLAMRKEGVSRSQLEYGSDGYAQGYSSESEEVLIPSFLAAYTGKSAEKIALDPFPSFKSLRPNWRISYNGLTSDFEDLKSIMKNVSLSQAYTSSYNVGSYSSNPEYFVTPVGEATNENTGDYIGKYDFSSVYISELFNPLFRIDIDWINQLSTSIGYTRNRTISLSFTNMLLTEEWANELSLEVGYRLTGLNFFVKTRNFQKMFSNDLNIRADLSFAKNKTILRYLEDSSTELSDGAKIVTLKTTADYLINKRFTLSAYLDQVLNNPYTSDNYRTTTTSFGLSFQFSLSPN